MKIVSAKALGKDAIRKLLTKPPFDEVQLSPKIREANKKIFGADLTAAEVALRIVKYRKRSLLKRQKPPILRSSRRWKKPRTMYAAITRSKRRTRG